MDLLRIVLLVLLAGAVGATAAQSIRESRAFMDAKTCATEREVATSYLTACALELLECQRTNEGATF